MHATLPIRSSTQSSPPLFGPVPDGCEVLRLASAGERSEVWKVCEVRTGRPFAWKRLNAEFVGQPSEIERLRIEARVLQSVDGRGLPALQRDLTDDNPPSLLREWLEGRPLSQRLVRGEPFPARTAFWIGRQIADGMRSLAAAGYAHGDLRPANVFVDDDGSVRLLGLGSVTPLDRRLETCDPVSVPTEVEYLAPERQTGSEIDPLAADVYSLGVVLFELLAGRPPFHGENPDDIRRLHRQAKPPRWNGGDSRIPAIAAEFVESLLLKEPLRRPRDLRLIVRQLLDLELQAMRFDAK